MFSLFLSGIIIGTIITILDFPNFLDKKEYKEYLKRKEEKK